MTLDDESILRRAAESDEFPEMMQGDDAVAHPSDPRPLLVCFSHLRWNFVRQRPQHLLTRAAAHFDVVFIEEPVFAKGTAPRLAREQVEPAVEVLVPILDEADPEMPIAVLRRLVAEELDGRSHEERVFWYYTPAAIAFTSDLARDLTLYDNMDELSAFRGAPESLIA